VTITPPSPVVSTVVPPPNPKIVTKPTSAVVIEQEPGMFSFKITAVTEAEMSVQRCMVIFVILSCNYVDCCPSSESYLIYTTFRESCLRLLNATWLTQGSLFWEADSPSAGKGMFSIFDRTQMFTASRPLTLFDLAIVPRSWSSTIHLWSFQSVSNTHENINPPSSSCPSKWTFSKFSLS
jgi:hypothetical protein